MPIQPRTYLIPENWPSDTIINPAQLRAQRLSDADFSVVHQNVIIPCHDAFIQYRDDSGKEGILLGKRKDAPLRDFWWTFGGKRARGVPAEESLRARIRAECGLELEELEYLGWADTIMDADPLGHGRGTHTTDLQYLARGVGKIKLDMTHGAVRIVTPEEYLDGFRNQLHPRITDFMDLIPGYRPNGSRPQGTAY